MVWDYFTSYPTGKRVKTPKETRLMGRVNVENLEKYGWEKKKREARLIQAQFSGDTQISTRMPKEVLCFVPNSIGE